MNGGWVKPVDWRHQQRCPVAAIFLGNPFGMVYRVGDFSNATTMPHFTSPHWFSDG